MATAESTKKAAELEPNGLAEVAHDDASPKTDEPTDSSTDQPTDSSTDVGTGSRAERRRARHRKRRRQIASLVGGTVLGVVIVAIGGFIFDGGLGPAAVPRNVGLDGRDISGFSATALDQRIALLADRFVSTPIVLITDEGEVETTAAELGYRVDATATAAAAMGTGDDRLLSRFGGWLRSWFATERVAVALVRPDMTELEPAVFALDPSFDIAPIEPMMRYERARLVADAGIDGQRIDTVGLRSDLPAFVARVDTPVEIAAAIDVIEPEVADDAVGATVDRLGQITAGGLELIVRGERAQAGPARLRRWLSYDAATDRLSIDEDAVLSYGARRFRALAEEGDPAVFNVQEGQLIVSQGSFRGRRCCSEDAPDQILAALVAGEESVRLELTDNPSPRDLAWSEEMQIRELVGEFTTRHACCQGRVTNIQRMADIVRGAVIEPGEMFSINNHVGKRTRENGFVGGGVIYNGEFTEDIGGGVSQFATTLFNAAFFGGYDFGEYQSHSKYISRYPFGREATVSFPAPDLQIINNSPYGVLIWTEYESTSITVKLYSTQWAIGEDVGRSTGRRGACQFVTTNRTRTFVDDGHTEDDFVVATYRGEGGRC